jgi:hypothetical protein
VRLPLDGEQIEVDAPAGHAHVRHADTHLRPQSDGAQAWQENVQNFFMKLKAEEGSISSFQAGYALHIFTDIRWSQTKMAEFMEHARSRSWNESEIKHNYYSDTDQLDTLLYQRMPWRSQVWASLKESDSPDMPGLLSADEIEKWKNRTLQWYDLHENICPDPLYYYDYKGLLSFIKDETPVVAQSLHSFL